MGQLNELLPSAFQTRALLSKSTQSVLCLHLIFVQIPQRLPPLSLNRLFDLFTPNFKLDFERLRLPVRSAPTLLLAPSLQTVPRLTYT
jgi:hypothetical protein